MGMGRRALEPGENGKTTFRGRHPKLGLWRSEASLKKDRVRPRVWRAEVRYHDPTQHKVRVLTAEGGTKGEAEANVTAALEQARELEGLHAGAGGMTVRRAARGHLRMLEDGHFDLAPKTVRAYAAVIRRHMLGDDCVIGHVPLKHLTALQIEMDMDRIVKADASTQLPNYKAILNAILKRAVKAGAIGENPMLRVSMPSAPRKKKRRVYGNGSARRVNQALTAEEDERLHRRLNMEQAHVADLVRVVRHQGLRIGEAASLRRQDVDLAAGAVTVAGKLIRVRGQGRVWDPTLKSDLSYRTLPIREGARGALERRLAAAEERGGLQYLFAPPGASKPDTDYWQRLARGVFDRAELPDVTAHTLRRTVERELEQAGATVSERETFMGHTERVARMHYADHGVVRQSIITAMDKSGVEVE